MDSAQSDAPHSPDPNTNAEPAKSSKQITVTQTVGSIASGEVAGIHAEHISGDVSVQSTINQIEEKFVQGDYVDRRTIVNNILALDDPHAIDELVNRLAAMLGVNRQGLSQAGADKPPEHIDRQIQEVAAAEKEVAGHGGTISAQATYELGMLALYRHAYDQALDYFRQATALDTNYLDAYASLAYVLETRAHEDAFNQNYDAALVKLNEAREAGGHTDPQSASALALRGFISQLLAAIWKQKRNDSEANAMLQESRSFFERALELEPNNPSVLSGIASVYAGMGDPDRAIKMYRRALKLMPNYARAYKDLALTYEDKMRLDARNASKWCQQALNAWKKFYEQSPSDPTITGDYLSKIAQRMQWLENECAKRPAPGKKPRLPQHKSRSR